MHGHLRGQMRRRASTENSPDSVQVPPLTEERRKQMAKSAKAAGEEGKVAVRNVRRDVLKKAGKLKLAKDDQKAMEDAVQKVTDEQVKAIDAIVAKKQKELTTV
jgi:ribosome recycling factor